MKSFLYPYNVNNYDPKMEEIGETIFEVWFIDNDYRQNTIDDQIQTVNKPQKTTFTVKDLFNNFNRRILTFYSDASYSYENESSQQTLDMSGDDMTDLWPVK
jgi:hypothetical protein